MHPGNEMNEWGLANGVHLSINILPLSLLEVLYCLAFRYKSMSFSTISRICGSESTPLPSASQDIMSFGWLRFHPSFLETGVAAPLYFYYRSAKVHARPSARAAMYYYTFGQFA